MSFRGDLDNTSWARRARVLDLVNYYRTERELLQWEISELRALVFNSGNQEFRVAAARSLQAMHSAWQHYARPWRGETKVSKEVSTLATKLREAWVAHFGDPNDPDVKAEIERTTAALEAETKFVGDEDGWG